MENLHILAFINWLLLLFTKQDLNWLVKLTQNKSKSLLLEGSFVHKIKADAISSASTAFGEES